MPLWFWAGFWGLLAGSALLLGAAGGYFSHIPQRLPAGVTAFGSGVLISATSRAFDDRATEHSPQLWSNLHRGLLAAVGAVGLAGALWAARRGGEA